MVLMVVASYPIASFAKRRKGILLRGSDKQNIQVERYKVHLAVKLLDDSGAYGRTRSGPEPRRWKEPLRSNPASSSQICDLV